MNINKPVKHLEAEARRELYKVIKPMCVSELYDVVSYVYTILDIRKEQEEDEK